MELAIRPLCNGLSPEVTKAARTQIYFVITNS